MGLLEWLNSLPGNLLVPRMRPGRRTVLFLLGLYTGFLTAAPPPARACAIADPAAVPFLQTFRQLETHEQKLQHLHSWQHKMGAPNGISDHNARRFEVLLQSYIFYHVDDTGVLNCQALIDNLFVSMYDRLELSGIHDIGYTMFNLVVDDLCPGFSPSW